MKAPKGQYFYLKNGKHLKNLHMLVAELHKVPDDVYNHHVNPEKNDFATWVQNSVNEIELAGRMKKAKNKFHMRHIVKEHIREKNVYNELQNSIKDVVVGSQNQLKTKVWISIFIIVSAGALVTFFSMLF